VSRPCLRFARACMAGVAGLLLAGVAGAEGQAGPGDGAAAGGDAAEGARRSTETAVATFAGGCFWCVEAAFEDVEGVRTVVSGYTGGHVEDPGYGQVGSGTTGHFEAVEVRYDPAKVGYARLLEVFWHNIDPLDGGGQFCDRGPQYRSAVFVHDARQRRLAEASRRALEASGTLPGPVETPILDAETFYPAEARHQDYARENPLRYAFYTRGCGRARRLEQVWGDEAGGH